VRYIRNLNSCVQPTFGSLALPSSADACRYRAEQSSAYLAAAETPSGAVQPPAFSES
jgi:hypothetical protein